MLACSCSPGESIREQISNSVLTHFGHSFYKLFINLLPDVCPAPYNVTFPEHSIFSPCLSSIILLGRMRTTITHIQSFCSTGETATRKSSRENSSRARQAGPRTETGRCRVCCLPSAGSSPPLPCCVPSASILRPCRSGSTCGPRRIPRSGRSSSTRGLRGSIGIVLDAVRSDETLVDWDRIFLAGISQGFATALSALLADGRGRFAGLIGLCS